MLLSFYLLLFAQNEALVLIDAAITSQCISLLFVGKTQLIRWQPTCSPQLCRRKQPGTTCTIFYGMDKALPMKQVSSCVAKKVTPLPHGRPRDI